MEIQPKYKFILFMGFSAIVLFGYYTDPDNKVIVEKLKKNHTSVPLDIRKLLKISGYGYYFQQCNCIKHKNKFGATLPMIGYKSTCSDEADWYGSDQKIVSFVLHHDGKNTLKFDVNSIMQNIYQVRQYYPGWILRLYTNYNVTKQLCTYACLNEVMWCDVRFLSFENLLNVNYRVWKFMPLGDPTVKIFVSREINNLICEREQEAVDEWENSTKSFHLARDSGTHHLKAILPGMWGAKNYLLDSNIAIGLRNAFIKHGKNNTNYKYAERMLKAIVFNKYESDILAHDSYTCEKWPSVESVPYPKQRKNKFTRVALPMHLSHKFEASPCPEECRPSYGQNWTYC